MVSLIPAPPHPPPACPDFNSPSLGIFDSLRYFRAVFSRIPDFNAATPNDIPRDNNVFKRRTWPSGIIATLILETGCDFLPRRLAGPLSRYF